MTNQLELSTMWNGDSASHITLVLVSWSHVLVSVSTTFLRHQENSSSHIVILTGLKLGHENMFSWTRKVHMNMNPNKI